LFEVQFCQRETARRVNQCAIDSYAQSRTRGEHPIDWMGYAQIGSGGSREIATQARLEIEPVKVEFSTPNQIAWLAIVAKLATTRDSAFVQAARPVSCEPGEIAHIKAGTGGAFATDSELLSDSLEPPIFRPVYQPVQLYAGTIGCAL
jgi:hypothetical protein